MSINTIDDAIGCCVTPGVLWTLRVGGWLTATELTHDFEFPRRLIDTDEYRTSHMHANCGDEVVFVQTKPGSFDRLLFFHIGTDEKGDYGICTKAGPPEADRPEPPVVLHQMASGRVARGSDFGTVFLSDEGGENGKRIGVSDMWTRVNIMASTKCGRTLFVAFKHRGEWHVCALDTHTEQTALLVRDVWDGAALIGVGWCDMTDRLFVCSGGRIVTVPRPKTVPYPVFTGPVYSIPGLLYNPRELTLYSDGVWGSLKVCGRSRILDCPPDSVAVNGHRVGVIRVRDWTRALIATREAIRRPARDTKRDRVLRIYGLRRMPTKKKKTLVPYSYTCTPRPACDRMRALGNFHIMQTAIIAANKTAGGGKVVSPSILQLVGKYTLLS